MNWLKKLFGYVECNRCNYEFIKKDDTACGNIDGKSIFYCKPCSKIIMNIFLSGKNPFKE